MKLCRVKIEDKPMYSLGLERLAGKHATDEEDVAELLSAMSVFAQEWIVPMRLEINVLEGSLSFVDVNDVEAIPEEVARATAGFPLNLEIVWDKVQARLPPEVEPTESTSAALSFRGSTDRGRMKIKIGIYWSAWLQFPQMLNDAIDRVLDRDTGWARAEWSLTQVNHWLDRDDED